MRALSLISGSRSIRSTHNILHGVGGATHLSRFAWAGFVLGVMLALAGCAGGRPLMPAPVLYRLAEFKPFGLLNDALQTNQIDVLYITDRQVEDTKDGGSLMYGIGRSNSVAFGAARVDVSSDASWDELKIDALAEQRARPLDLTLVQVEELGRAPPTPTPGMLVDGVIVPDPDIAGAQRQVVEVFHATLVKRLALTDRKEVFLYIHGIQNSFADAVFVTSELWHFMGREGVPIAYTWPAGAGGLLRGYTRDRESGEFTIYHLKNAIRLLASFPEVKALNVVAHSRGTDVFVTAMRELLIEIRASNRNPREVLKVRNVVLAAPDLDLSVTMQRVAAERLGTAFKRITIYTSPNDKAISVAEFLFGGLARLGQLDLLQLNKGSEMVAVAASSANNIAIIEYTGSRSGSFGHSYFRENPAVASDLFLALRYDRDPGAANGRPLKQVGPIFWTIDDNYLVDAGSSKP